MLQGRFIDKAIKLLYQIHTSNNLVFSGTKIKKKGTIQIRTLIF